MTKPVRLRSRAADDIEQIIEHYQQVCDDELAARFVAQLEQALGYLSRYPLTGSLGYSYELGIPGLRTWRLERFPHLVFYVDDDTGVDVWRVLHGRRDIPGYLRPESA